MLQGSHENAASVLDALEERSPSFDTALDIVEPIRGEDDPSIITANLLDQLQDIIGVSYTNTDTQFMDGVRFEVPQGFQVDDHREVLSALLQGVLDSEGEVFTRANTSW